MHQRILAGNLGESLVVPAAAQVHLRQRHFFQRRARLRRHRFNQQSLLVGRQCLGLLLRFRILLHFILRRLGAQVPCQRHAVAIRGPAHRRFIWIRARPCGSLRSHLLHLQCRVVIGPVGVALSLQHVGEIAILPFLIVVLSQIAGRNFRQREFHFRCVRVSVFRKLAKHMILLVHPQGAHRPHQLHLLSRLHVPNPGAVLQRNDQVFSVCSESAGTRYWQRPYGQRNQHAVC